MKKILSAAIVGVLVTACATTEVPQLTPLELQALQQREFDASKEIAFAATMSVFQDLGYTVEAGDLDTGLITASSTAESTRDWVWTGSRFTTQTRATAFIEKAGEDRSRVRLNFVTGTETSTAYGSRSQKDNQILEPGAYQSAFEKIETAIFIRQE
jgi:hypothetical protein